MYDVSSLISMWPKPSLTTFAEDVGAKRNTVIKWRSNDAIPAWYMYRVHRAAQDRDIPLSALDLIQMADPDLREERDSEED